MPNCCHQRAATLCGTSRSSILQGGSGAAQVTQAAAVTTSVCHGTSALRQAACTSTPGDAVFVLRGLKRWALFPLGTEGGTIWVCQGTCGMGSMPASCWHLPSILTS
jgi:hypothetical protein